MRAGVKQDSYLEEDSPFPSLPKKGHLQQNAEEQRSSNLPSLRIPMVQFISTSNGATHVRPNIPFRILVDNLRRAPKLLYKRKILVKAFPHLMYVIDTSVSIGKVLNIEFDSQTEDQKKKETWWELNMTKV